MSETNVVEITRTSALAKELMSAAAGGIRDNAAVIADAVAGKPPLPPPPDRDAPIFTKIHRRATRGFARTHRFCITAAPLLGTVAALSVLVASVFYVGHFFIPAVR